MAQQHQLGSFQRLSRFAKGAATKPASDEMDDPEMYFASMKWGAMVFEAPNPPSSTRASTVQLQIALL
jgi:hypothetical protein